MSDYSLLRAADAPDFTGDSPGAFLAYGHALGSEQLAFNVRVLAPGTAHVPPGGGRSVWIGDRELVTFKATGKDTGGRSRWWK